MCMNKYIKVFRGVRGGRRKRREDGRRCRIGYIVERDFNPPRYS